MTISELLNLSERVLRANMDNPRNDNDTIYDTCDEIADHITPTYESQLIELLSEDHTLLYEAPDWFELRPHRTGFDLIRANIFELVREHLYEYADNNLTKNRNSA